MPNVSSVLKDEITRVARKAVKSELDALRRANAGYRKDIAALKRIVSDLQRGQKASLRTGKAKPVADVGDHETEPTGKRSRFSAKGLKTLRAKLGLSAAEMGQLAGTSGQSIYNWEQGKNVPRAKQADALAALRGIGKREAAARLAALAEQS